MTVRSNCLLGGVRSETAFAHVSDISRIPNDLRLVVVIDAQISALLGWRPQDNACH